MASYKVPQDVEADDKLIGPFSFRQFIYLIIVVLAGAGAWGLAQIFIGLAIIPLPVIILFGALALPLRKDQPMEIYLAAIISFYLKPRRRMWDPDGIDSFIEITTPKIVEVQLTKNLTQSDTEQRLSYLANLVDTGGWAIRGAVSNTGPMTNDMYLEAQEAEDILDTSNTVAQSINTMMDRRTHEIREEAIERMHHPLNPQPNPQPIAAPAPQQQPQPGQYVLPPEPIRQQPAPQPVQQHTQDPYPTPIFNPYPNSMQQTVIQPMSDITTPDPVSSAAVTTKVEEEIMPVTPVTTSEKHISPDIINLANNTGLSIQTIAHEAQRIQEKENAKAEEEEVIISLR